MNITLPGEVIFLAPAIAFALITWGMKQISVCVRHWHETKNADEEMQMFLKFEQERYLEVLRKKNNH